jgi:hypothetical protein
VPSGIGRFTSTSENRIVVWSPPVSRTVTDSTWSASGENTTVTRST